MNNQEPFEEPQITKPKLRVQLQQINNPPKGETRTAMMSIEYSQPQVLYDFRSKHQKNTDEKNQLLAKKSSIMQMGQKMVSNDSNINQHSSSNQGSSSHKKVELDKSLDRSKNEPQSASTIPAPPAAITGQEPLIVDEIKETAKDQFKHKEISIWRRKVKRLLQNQMIVWFFQFLTFLYLFIMFISIAAQQLLNDDDAYTASLVINTLELHLLACLISEFSMRAYAQGFQNYFREKLQLLDCFIIILTLFLVILDLSLGRSPKFTKIASVIKGMFRFFRIVLLFRKSAQFKKIKVSSTIKTPAEKIIDIFTELKEFFDSKEVIEDLDWSVNIIASNKLYETNIIQGGEKNGDVNQLVQRKSNLPILNYYQKKLANWINYGARQNQNNEENKDEEDQLAQVKVLDTKLQPYIVGIPPQVIEKFKDVNEIHFDCFELEKISEGQETSFLLLHLFSVNNILGSLEIDPYILNNFFKQIEKGYKDNLYHNRLHAFDVLQTSNFFLKACNFQDLAGINEFDLCTIYISAACHDYDHPGFNNAYIINTQHDIALTYNDQSVLENHHASQTFLLFNDPNLDITAQFTKEQYRNFRSMVISIILSTDMSKHFSDIAKLKSRMGAADYDMKGKDKQMCIDTIIHACDVSNPVKTWGVYQQWAGRVLSEFWNQGDQERSQGLTITYLCDKYTTNTAKSQVGFIDFVVRPLYEVISNFLPEVKNYMQQIDSNKNKWNELIPFYEQELEKQKNQQHSELK